MKVREMTPRIQIAVGIATAGRRDLLTETLRELAAQTRPPDCVFVCPAIESDFDAGKAADLPFELHLVKGSKKGSCPQRNAIIDAAGAFDLILFFDDDFLAAPTYLAEAEACFQNFPDIVAATGLVIKDGIKGPGLDLATARAALAAYSADPAVGFMKESYNAYGCNMVFRVAPILAHGLRFDENLALYGWLEDVDLCRQLADHGRIVKNERMVGVHLGNKAGRTPGVRFGYSQIANPIYLFRKGTYRADLALRQMGRNLLANFGNFISPEPWVDRRGRVRGNLIALRDLLLGRLDPRRILDLG
jgi:GT2 family glycosyltransferase